MSRILSEVKDATLSFVQKFVKGFRFKCLKDAMEHVTLEARPPAAAAEFQTFPFFRDMQYP